MTTWPPNPYDFSLPATKDSFAGRKRELAILKEFALAVDADHPTHLLLHGRRGMGKTSLLARLADELSDSSVSHGLIRLDQTSAARDAFFAEAITKLAFEIVRSGGLGGMDGAYDRELQRALAGDQVDPSVGPLRVAQAAGRGRDGAIPDVLIERDLEELVDTARELGSPGLVLLVDEADQLIERPPTIQRIRNLLLSSGLVSVVLAGTDAFVAALDTVLAPAGRHFRKIDVRPLASLHETRQCIGKPLSTAGISGQVDIAPGTAEEVHSLTGGSPYEITLLCREMYDRMRDGDDGVMRLSAGIIESVTEQLRPSDVQQRALSTLRDLAPDVLAIAAKYCVDPRVTLEEHARLRLAFADLAADAIAGARAEVADEWRVLIDHAIASRDGDFLETRLDDVARIYLKYRAAALGVLPSVAEGDYADRVTNLLVMKVRDAITACGAEAAAFFPVLHADLAEGREPQIGDEVRMLAEGNINGVTRSPQLLSFVADVVPVPEAPNVSYAIWALPFEVRENGAVVVVVLAVSDAAGAIASFNDSVAAAFEAARPYGVERGETDHAHVGADEWELVKVGTRAFMADVAIRNGFGTLDSARLQQVGEEAVDGLPAGALIEPRLESIYLLLNDLAFVRLTRGHLVEALELFERCAAAGGLFEERDAGHRAILSVNLAACAAGMGKYVEAISYAEDAMALVAAGSEAAQAGWLIVYQPDPEWPKRPTLLEKPDAHVVALATKAGAMAALGQDAARELAADVVELSGEPWALDVQASVERRLAT